MESLVSDLEIGRRYRVRYHTGYMPSGGGSLNLAANAITSTAALARSIAVGDTQAVTIELTDKSWGHISGKNVHRLWGVTKGTVSIETHEVVSITPA